jgi:hypothetical protein
MGVNWALREYRKMRSMLLLFLCLLVVPASAQTYSTDDVFIVQQKLQDGNYNIGNVDGRFGPKTAAAIKLYQSDWQIAETGEISSELISRLNSTYSFANGDRYLGTVRDGKQHGQGVYVWANGVRYEGVFSAGNYNGQGVFTWVDGERYEGTFRDGKYSGQGVLTRANGNRYQGAWRDGNYNGRGVFTWADGRRYEGAWLDGKADGQGTFREATGKAYSGEWRRGCLSKDGKYITVGTTKEACGFK